MLSLLHKNRRYYLCIFSVRGEEGPAFTPIISKKFLAFRYARRQEMNNYSIRIEVEDGKVEEILDRLSKAQKEIYKCYTELENLGVLTLRETATPKE